MYTINNDDDFNRELREQQHDVQVKLNYYSGLNKLSRSVRDIIFNRIQARGKELRAYFKKCNGI